jgi:hypothetical protein
MAAKISHILVRGFCDSPPRESIPVAQALTTPTAKNAKAIIDYLCPNINTTNVTALRNYAPSQN